MDDIIFSTKVTLATEIYFIIADFDIQCYVAIRSINRAFRDYSNENIEKYKLRYSVLVEKTLGNGDKERYRILPNKIKHGIYQRWFSDGRMKMKYFYKNGLMEGLYQEWYEHCGKLERSMYQEGKLNGYQKTFYYNGCLKSKSFYKNGVLNGVEKKFYENKGGKQQFCYYVDGSKSGIYKYWWWGNKIYLRIECKNGKKEGLYLQWWFNGNKNIEGMYKDDKKIGLQKAWKENGKLLCSVFFNDL